MEGREDIARQYGEILGSEAAAAGFNWVFAPILDVHTNANNPVIGDRALAQEPETVARLALAKASGLMDAGVMPCGKHFPGHGDTDKDSHLTLPTVSHPRERLEAIEWLPFRAAVQAKLPAIMTAHVLFPALDPVYPATLSPLILRDILRDAWGYDGLVVSDDLEMKGVADHYPIEEIVVRGLQAGIDLFLLCRVWEALTPATEAVLAALREGTLSEERLLASWQRIMRAKSRFASFANRCTPETIDGFLAEQQEHRTQAAHLQARWTDASRPA
jgi:beta-N-acetylhexosaminidase